MIKYIEGLKNIVADALSRLNLILSPSNVNDIPECYGLDKKDLPSDTFLITYQLMINCEQNKDKTLLATIKNGAKNYSLKEFYGGSRSSQLLCYKNRIIIPQGLQKRVVQWYHHTLCHPGINQTKETISQHFYWKNMRDQITCNVSTCSVCQKQKKQRKKYGLPPEKEAEYNPWEHLCIALIGPYKIRTKNVATKYQI